MKQIFLVLKREYLTRVKKKSFLLATILTPLILPLLLFGIFYFANQEKASRSDKIMVLDESGFFKDVFDVTSFEFTYISGDLESGKTNFLEEGAFGLLYIPAIDMSDASVINFSGFELYSRTNPSVQAISRIERVIRTKLEDIKLDRSGLDATVIKNLKVNVDLDSFNISDSGEAKESNSKLSFGLGYGTGFLIYMFIFIYGSQIMQSVLDEKTSRIVEVIVSSVKPFQLMMGKILGVGAVGFTQLLIWFVLIGGLSTAGLSYFAGNSEVIMEAASQQVPQEALELTSQQEMAREIQGMLSSVPIVKILLSFLFFFLGAYFLYGALYAAIGSAVDSLQDAQQFMFPVMLPILAGIMSMFPVLEDPNGGLAVTLSLIPFTSPIIMMARIPFGVPDWQLALSMVLLIAGFIGTIWMAGRVYRVGILMYGVKVNWKTIAKWFTMKV